MPVDSTKTQVKQEDSIGIQFGSPKEELAALISFITSTSADALPVNEPTLPLEPAIVLDFDPARASARDDLDLLVSEINSIYPVVLFGKMRDPYYREIKDLGRVQDYSSAFGD